jgi:uncharacterized delta-60 repeat protein
MTKKLFILVSLLLMSTPIFAQSVDTAWVRRYNGPGNEDDEAYAVAVDDSGSVYVTGGSCGSGTEPDYVTIKYSPNGDTAWVRRYDGPGTSEDIGCAIAIDDSGNIYVTGWSRGSGYHRDYASIKYYPNGDTAWVRRYNGPGNSDDLAYVIAVDGSGNVYVTGESYGSGYQKDYATIKYYPNGDTAWVRRYDGPGTSDDAAYCMAVDASGNIYVAGESGVGWDLRDYATVKYYPNGDTAWVRRYDGPVSYFDCASAIGVDNSGNIYVAGYSSQDSVNGCNLDYATIKYYPNGDTAWVRRYNGPVDRGDDYLSAVALDDYGNVYVTGQSRGSGTDYDYASIKYHANGDTAWVRRYNGPGNEFDKPNALAVDESGNVYVTGGSYSGWIDYDYATIRYYPNGDTAWVRRYNGPGNSTDFAHAIATDGSGNVYVTGYSYGTGTDYDYATIKYVQFLRGDVNRDGVVDIEDAVYLINYLYIDGLSPIPILQVGDANCNRAVDLGDVVYLISYVYRGGPAPCI